MPVSVDRNAPLCEPSPCKPAAEIALHPLSWCSENWFPPFSSSPDPGSPIPRIEQATSSLSLELRLLSGRHRSDCSAKCPQCLPPLGGPLGTLETLLLYFWGGGGSRGVKCSTPSPPTKSFPTKSPWVKLSGRLPIRFHGHENSHPSELRVCSSQTLRNANS